MFVNNPRNAPVSGQNVGENWVQDRSVRDGRSVAIAVLDSGNTESWDAFVDAQPGASLYQSSGWRNVIARVFGHETYYLYAMGVDGKLLGVLPLVRLRSRLFGDYLVSVPYFNYGGALATDETTAQALMEHACELARNLGSQHVEFRDTAKRPGDWAVRTDKVILELELPGSADVLWTALGSKLRAQIKRPTKEGIQVVWGGAELLDDFYQVFARNMRDLGTPVYSVTFFAAILETFRNAASIAVARYQGIPVAAGFLLGYKQRLEIPWAASLRKYNVFGSNMLLYWEVLKKAIEDGYQVFDFGRSSIDSGTYRFKKQWGTRERPLFWHYWIRPGQAMPNLTPNNPRYRLAIRLWQRLPLPIANSIGPFVVKNLP